ncbi:hypothetical protein [Propionimicrobium sp. PCR01-08-3]|uniref:hypothetical protein n=1 Tax=Propionimicrobium sp. PCR01-08-3 TaxID=3052086 RepID=UPI00255C4D19|nr:hypothetical protein [Propionimicrobium sp. PCR01-08-3]WIY83576.1 hypothetical protein QQ658_04265 [Propionimicrobium sp. PCR01-08-3]
MEDGNATYAVVIVDDNGREQWRSEKLYGDADGPGLFWESEADALWILSADLGTSKVSRDEAANWTQEWTTEGMPPEIDHP